MNYRELGNKISAWLRDYLEESGLNCFVVGVSGGMDSALTSTLAAQTGLLTYVLNLPIHSAEKHSRLANRHCRQLSQDFANVIHLEQDFSAAYAAFIQAAEPGNEPNPLAAANSKSRLRMMALYYLASKHAGIVVGTGNKVEDFGVGFFTKYGDGGVDISPIADLSKTQVRHLGRALGILPEILAAPPTDGLWQDERTDEQQMGVTYEELERAMAMEERGLVPANEREHR